jgi:hypothetical protein
LKTAGLLFFLMVSGAVSMQGTGYAAQSSPKVQEKNAPGPETSASDSPQGDIRGGRASHGDHQKNGESADGDAFPHRISNARVLQPRGGLSNANRPKQIPNNREHSNPRNAMNLHSLSSAKTGGRAVEGRTQGLNRIWPVQPQGALRPNSVAFANARHRGPNPAIIGGSAISDGRKNVSINGTRIVRRP